jgi:hypothetical protein
VENCLFRIYERQSVPVLADRAYQGTGLASTNPKRPPGGELSTTQHTVNRALSHAQAPVEHGIAQVKSRPFGRAVPRCLAAQGD